MLQVKCTVICLDECLLSRDYNIEKESLFYKMEQCQ